MAAASIKETARLYSLSLTWWAEQAEALAQTGKLNGPTPLSAAVLAALTVQTGSSKPWKISWGAFCCCCCCCIIIRPCTLTAMLLSSFATERARWRRAHSATRAFLSLLACSSCSRWRCTVVVAVLSTSSSGFFSADAKSCPQHVPRFGQPVFVTLFTRALTCAPHCLQLIRSFCELGAHVQKVKRHDAVTVFVILPLSCCCCWRRMLCAMSVHISYLMQQQLQCCSEARFVMVENLGRPSFCCRTSSRATMDVRPSALTQPIRCVRRRAAAAPTATPTAAPRSKQQRSALRLVLCDSQRQARSTLQQISTYQGTDSQRYAKQTSFERAWCGNPWRKCLLISRAASSPASTDRVVSHTSNLLLLLYCVVTGLWC
jgi:hypothetical protein